MPKNLLYCVSSDRGIIISTYDLHSAWSVFRDECKRKDCTFVVLDKVQYCERVAIANYDNGRFY